MKEVNLAIIILILSSFLIGAYLYPQMSDTMASHWNVTGEVDGYMPKFLGLFLMPIITILLFGLYLVIPRIDPLRKNIKKFRSYYDMFIFIIIIFLFYVHGLSLAWNLGFYFNMSIMIIPALALLLYCTGILTQNAERNWFIGIRTPWTLSNEKVWKKTHKIGGKLFKISAFIALMGIFSPRNSIWFILTPLLVSVFYTILYSYFEYQKIKKH